MRIVNLLRTLPERLSRVTTGGKLIREIDGLRFIAIFPVVVQHLSERVERYLKIDFHQGPLFEFFHYITHRGFVGVYIFFVISGFILGMPFASHFLKGTKKVSLRNYFWRRITRLEPPYLIIMTFIAVVTIILGYHSLNEILPHYFASIFYLHGIVYGAWSYINPPTWTLEIEVQFYILAPFIATLAFKIPSVYLRRSVFIGGILCLLGLQQYYSVLMSPAKLTILAHIHYFLIGFLLVDIYLIDWREGIKKHWCYTYLGVLAMVSIVYFWSWDYEFLNRLIFAVSLFVLVFSVFKSTILSKFLSLPWITAIGGMCYTIYLIHLPLIEFLIKYTRGITYSNSFVLNFIIQFFLIVPLVLIVSIVLFLLIEKPCMNRDWPKKLMNRLKGQS